MAAPKRFFAETIAEETVLSEEESRHAAAALRLTEGDEVTLFDGGGFFDDYTEAGDLLLGRQLRLPGVSDGAEGGGE